MAWPLNLMTFGKYDMAKELNIMFHFQYIHFVGLKPRKPSQLLYVHTTSDQKSMNGKSRFAEGGGDFTEVSREEMTI